MNNIITAALFGYVLFFGTWLFYIAFMGLKTHIPNIKDEGHCL